MKRTFWLGLLIVLSQVSAGCCCWQQRCAHWRAWRASHCLGAPACGPVCGPMVGPPACPSCYTPPAIPSMGPAMVYSAPPAGGMLISPPTPFSPGPTIEPPHPGIPQPMPKPGV
jgi:hypothetical protein